jgi:hypothetical protein
VGLGQLVGRQGDQTARWVENGVGAHRAGLAKHTRRADSGGVTPSRCFESLRRAGAPALGSLTALVLLAASVGSCGGADRAQVKTVTVTSPNSTATAPEHNPKRPRTGTTGPAAPKFVSCDSNIQAKAHTTTCGFAQNA